MKDKKLTDAVNQFREEENSAPAQPGNVAKSRENKKAVVGYFAREVHTQLKQMALLHDRSMQELLGEAMNDLFRKYRLPPIA